MSDDDSGTLAHELRSLTATVVRAGRVLDETLSARLSAEASISLDEFEALAALDAASGGRLRMTDVSKAVHVGKAGVTRLVDRLAARGLVERVPCPTDRRAIWAQITPDGRGLLEQAVPLVEGTLQELVGARVDGDDAARARAVLALLADLG
jgi:DNA-binding MarR family transcriptional regulator